MYRLTFIFHPSTLLKIRSIKSNHYKSFSYKLKSTIGLADDKKVTPFGWLLLTIPATTFGLGCWQVQRKAWKESLIKELERSTNAEPVYLPDNLDDISTMEYRPVILRGTFLHDKELYLGPRSLIRPNGAESHGGLFSQRNESNGYLIITPFKLTGKEETILVNRGWVPRRMLKPETRQKGQIEGEVELIGVVRKGENRPQFTPDHKGSTYLYRDLQKMCAETGADPIFVDAKYESSVQGGPVGGQTRVLIRNEHLSYIITWYSLSVATAYMWYRQIVKRKAF